MKKIKKNRYGKALFAMAVLGMAALAFPEESHAYGQGVADWLAERTGYNGYRGQNCQGYPIVTLGSAREVYSRVGAFGSYRLGSYGECQNDVLFLKKEAYREWQACNRHVRAATFIGLAGAAIPAVVAAGPATTAAAAAARTVIMTGSYRGFAITMATYASAEAVTR
ncbi:hypothetical protein [Candidatus Foliamicus sp.]